MDGQTADGQERAPDDPDAAGHPDGDTDTAGHPDGDTDAATDADTDGDAHDSLRFDRWRKRSATGAVLTGVALGLQHALDQPKQEPSIVVEAAGEPEDDQAPLVVRLDPDDPTATVAVVRQPPKRPAEPPTGEA